MKVDSVKIRNWIACAKTREVSALLKKYDHQVRKEILIALSKDSRIIANLISELIELVRTDFLDNSTLAMELLNATLGMKNNHKRVEIKEVNECLDDRIRRANNYQNFNAIF